jgi:hypothetical protein
VVGSHSYKNKEIYLGALALLLSVIYCASKNCIDNTQDHVILSFIVRLFNDDVSSAKHSNMNNHQHVVSGRRVSEVLSTRLFTVYVWNSGLH